VPSGLHRISDEWRAALDASGAPWLLPALRRLRRDGPFVWTLVGAGGLGLAYLGVALGGGDLATLREGYAFVAMGGVAALALAAGARGAQGEGERRLHVAVSAGLLCWTAAEALESLVWDGDSGGLAIAIDALYLGLYAALLVAADGARSWRAPRQASALRRLERLELAVFLVGLLVYFVVVPARSDPAAYLSAVPSSIFYLWLDALLLVAFARRGRRATRPRERFRWTALRVSAALFAATDALDLMVLSGRLGSTPVPLDALWYLPFVTLVAAVRVGPVERAERAPRPPASETPEPPASEPPNADLGWGLAALLPLGHLVVETTAALDAATAAPRRAVVGVATAALVGLAVRHQQHANRVGRRLLEEVEAMRARAAAGSRLEAIGELAGGVAHDFRHLVNELRRRIATFAERELDERSRRDVEAMARATERAAALTQELLAVGQREPPQRRPLELRRWLLEVAPALRELCGERIELVVEARQSELWCAADPTQLERVASNLAANARDAMPGGGRLEIRLERLPATAGARGEWATIRFRDGGAGMDRVTRERIFEPFFTTKTERVGHGLGLATALGLVRAHGGDIRVESEPRRGSTFEVLLPLEAPRRADDGAGAPR
jgi:signal transduction histidine kinase